VPNPRSIDRRTDRQENASISRRFSGTDQDDDRVVENVTRQHAAMSLTSEDALALSKNLTLSRLCTL